MTTSLEKVKEFHKAFSAPISDKPTAGTQQHRKLRVALIAEELCELCEALGVTLTVYANKITWIEAHPDASKVDLVGVADALGDLDYVVQGANLTFGMPAEEVMQEIHRSNMAKLGPDGVPIRRPDGKILKPDGWTPPDLKTIVERASK